MTAKLIDSNPNMNDMPAGSTHWKCLLRHRGAQMTTSFSMGPAHSREPEAADVLDCLASDASGVENASNFSDWCSEYGYSDDSRKAERVYNACRKQAEGLKRLLGNDRYNELLWNVEKL